MPEPSKINEPEHPDDKSVRLLEDHVAMLKVHFESVRVFCTRQDGLITKTYTSGLGNYYAQMGQIHEWMTMNDEVVRENERDKNAEE